MGYTSYVSKERICVDMCLYPVVRYYIRENLCVSVQTAWQDCEKYICKDIITSSGISEYLESMYYLNGIFLTFELPEVNFCLM